LDSQSDRLAAQGQGLSQELWKFCRLNFVDSGLSPQVMPIIPAPEHQVLQQVKKEKKNRKNEKHKNIKTRKSIRENLRNQF